MRGPHFDYLDGWRGLAISLLLIGHFFPVPGINFGQVGVNLFFVLSGLLMARLLFIQRTPIPVFYKRRISRILPAHVFFLATIVASYISMDQAVSWTETAYAAAFLNNYFTGELGHPAMPFGHIWSLSVEEHSYIILSLVAVASRKHWIDPLKAIFLCGLVSAAMGTWYWTQYTGQILNFDKWLHTEVAAYGIFISAGLQLHFQNRGLPRTRLWVVAALIAVGLSLHWWSVPNPIRTIVGIGLFALAINLLPETSSLLRRLFSIAPLRYLGIWSFSIYLWQQPFYYFAHEHPSLRFVALLLAIGTGICSFYFIERPIRSTLNQYWAKEARQE